jgi:hypothetical protein
MGASASDASVWKTTDGTPRSHLCDLSKMIKMIKTLKSEILNVRGLDISHHSKR